MISIIIPIYNAERYLHKCIDSILAQTFTEFELLLINDGSTDKSGEICNEYISRDLRLKVFHKRNGGVSSARNLGLDNALGKWVTFVDSDDFVKSDWLDIYIHSIEKEAQLLVQGFNYNTKNKKNYFVTIEEECYLESVGMALRKLYDKKMVGYIWNKLFENRIIQKYNIRFNEIYKIREDEDFVLSYLIEIQNVKFIKGDGGYVYEMPDFSSKYKNLSDFWCISDLIHKSKNIYKNSFSGQPIYHSYVQLACKLIISETLDIRKLVVLYELTKENFRLIPFNRYSLLSFNLLKINISYMYWKIIFIILCYLRKGFIILKK